MSRGITRVTALVTSAACTLSAGAAAAAPAGSSGVSSASSAPGAAQEAAATPVDVVLVGRAGTEGSLAARIESWFGRTATLTITKEPELVAERVLGPLPERRVAVWVTLRNPTEARLYFAVTGETQAPTRYLLRDVPLQNGFDEIGSERVAQVVHSSVTALVEGSIEVAERPEIERELGAPPAPKPERVSPESTVPAPHHTVPPNQKKESTGPAFAPLVGAFYRGAYGGDEGFSHGPGVALGATFRFDRFGIGAVARGQYIWRHTERFDELDITLGGAAARLAARGEWLASTGLTVDLELGGGMFFARYDPEPTLAGPAPGKRGVDPRFFWLVSAGLSGSIGQVRVGGRFELELYPVKSHYKLDTGEAIGSNARVQPGFVFEVILD